jgi:DNA-binding NtrC family response regulator
MPAPTIHQTKAGGPGGGDGTLHLTVMGPGLFETHPLPTSGAVSIGRDDRADVRITDELASHLHARLHVDAQGGLAVEDLGSSNGTSVRSELIAKGGRVALQPGEAISIGNTILMVQRRRPRAQSRRYHGHGAFEERLEDACARAAETGAALAVARVRVEDEGTPGRGAELIAAGLRPGDFLAQYAPGDYEILLLDTAPERARALADDVARRLRADGLAVKTAVAAHPADGRSAEVLIGRASAALRGQGETEENEHDPILKSPTARAVYQLAKRAAKGTSAAGLINVLVLGETGTGKEVLADWIHRHSPRADGPFVCINCGALTASLLESELFGHKKGAFTGAVEAKAGLLEAAAGGTVFLDEIGEMPFELQAKLLRALENRQVTRVGEVSSRGIDVRFIAATNRDLEADIASQRFRQDLYFRLNGISLTLPPLRERLEEIEPLAARFLSQASAASKRRPPRLSKEAADILRGYRWDGNIRELRNVIERALVLCDDDEKEITAAHLPVEKLRLAPAVTAAGGGAAPVFVDAEHKRVYEALVSVGFNQGRAAKKLGMARGTLIERMKRYKIKRPQDAPAE